MIGISLDHSFVFTKSSWWKKKNSLDNHANPGFGRISFMQALVLQLLNTNFRCSVVDKVFVEKKKKSHSSQNPATNFSLKRIKTLVLKLEQPCKFTKHKLIKASLEELREILTFLNLKTIVSC